MQNFDNNSMMDEVAAEFQGLQELYGDDVSSHKAEMGLDVADNFLLDDLLSSEEQEILNAEVTEEQAAQIRELFKHCLMASAFAEVTEYTKQRAAENGFDAEKAIEPLIEVQEKMASTMKRINTAQKLKNVALKDLDSWVKRYNSWKASPKYAAFQDKKRAADAFFAGLKTRKEANANLKVAVADLWDTWNALREHSNTIAPTGSPLWTMYNALAETEMNRYFTNGDTEQVDDFSLLANAQHDVMDCLAFAHVVEMAEENKPEASGIGFWNFGNEYRVQRNRSTMYSAVAQREEEDYLQALVQSI